LNYVRLLTLAALLTGTAFGQGTITTYAGASKCCASADGGPATSAWLSGDNGIAMDRQGNLYLWDSGSTIRKVNANGIISTVAGNGAPGYTGDGGPATSASLFANGSISGLAVDAAGNLYISDGENHVIRKVNTAGIISTFAGTGAPGFSGDGGPATAATLNFPAGIALDSAGNLYIADASNNRVRKVNTAGIISTYAGNGNVVFSGDGVQATTTAVQPEGLTVDSAGNLYIAETSDSRIRKVDTSGVITTIAGQTKKTSGFSGDGGPATAAALAGPIGMVVDPSGNLYFADNSNSRVRKVSAAGIITTYAGISGNSSTPIGDGGPATSAFLGNTKDVVLDSAGNLYIASSAGGVVRIRKVTPGAAGLSASPTSLSFAYTIGGTTPTGQTVTVSNASAVSFTAAASTTSGNDWLSVTPTSGATPSTLTVSVNPAGLPGGVYQGAVTLTPNGGSAVSFSVTLTVTGAGAPIFSATGVVNALGYQNKLAPDTVFVIFGSGMGPANLAAGSAPDYPTTLGGTSITFTPAAGGTAVNARMVYTTAGQIAGLLPSSIAPGTYAVRVTYNSLASAPQNVTVVARSFGIATSNSAGTGTAQATIGNVNGGVSLTRFTTGSTAFNGLNWTLSPAHPGDTLVLWGTGGGADSANDTGGSSGDQTAAGNFKVVVSGRQITPLFAGASSGYPGLWQINFTLPPDIAPDCFASVQVSAGGELSNAVTVPIAAGGQTACSDPQLSATALAALDAGGAVALGGFSVIKTSVLSAPSNTTTNVESATAVIPTYNAAEYAAVFSGVKIGACYINDRTAPATAKSPATPDGYLDAGSPLPLTGPGVAAGAGLTVAVANPGPIYLLNLANGTLASGGKYTISSSGGKGTGPFNASVTFPTNFSVANWNSLTSIDRSQPLTINWTGSGVDQVFIIGSTSGVVGKDANNTNIIHTAAFTCTAPGAPGTFTIPAAVLAYLLPASIGNSSGTGITANLIVEGAAVQTFNLPLVSGGQATYSAFSALQAFSRNVAVQ
jgi:uncharacterized protein (TIGR03437 family)